jgi:hypothetical protein
MVKPGMACPSRSLTTLIGTPALMSSVPWLAQFMQADHVDAGPARRVMRSKFCEIACGRTGSP